MYYQIYSILVEHIYGNPETLTAFQELTCTQVSTCLCLIAVCLPLFAALCVMRWFFK